MKLLTGRDAIPAKPMLGTEPLRGTTGEVGPVLKDFWRWSCSDLLDNVVRGAFAEYLVAHALDLTDTPRQNWTPYDLTTERGTRIEVKSSAYIQSWAQGKLSTVSFNIARRKQKWNRKTNKMEKLGQPARISHIYVFCLLSAGDLDSPPSDPLETSSWTFWVVTRDLIDRIRPTSDSIGRSSLMKLSDEHADDATEVDFQDLRLAVNRTEGRIRNR